MTSTSTPAPDIRAIPRRYVQLALLSGIPLLALILTLGAVEYRRQYDAALQARIAYLEDRRTELQAVTGAAAAHVIAMRTSMVTDLDVNWDDATPPTYVAAGRGDAVVGLNRAPQRDRGEPHGTLIGTPGELAARASSRAELAAIDRLFLLQSANHVANSDIRRSYFLSGPKDLAAFYPWQSLDAVLSGADRMT